MCKCRAENFGFLALMSWLALCAAAANGQALLPDPTRPLEYQAAESAPDRLVLNSILVGNNRKLAVINGQVLAEQEEKSGLKVLKIYSDKVVVLFNGQQQNLVLRQSLRIVGGKD